MAKTKPWYCGPEKFDRVSNGIVSLPVDIHDPHPTLCDGCGGRRSVTAGPGRKGRHT